MNKIISSKKLQKNYKNFLYIFHTIKGISICDPTTKLWTNVSLNSIGPPLNDSKHFFTDELMEFSLVEESMQVNKECKSNEESRDLSTTLANLGSTIDLEKGSYKYF